MFEKHGGSHFMMPFAVGGTIVVGGSAIAELLSHGAMKSPDTAAELYLAIMAAYAGAGELQKWKQQKAGLEPAVVPDDPWLERARKGGLFVGFWLLVYTAAYILRIFDLTYPMPHELKSITLQIVALFFVTYSVRTFRRGKTSSASLDDGQFDALVTRYIGSHPEGVVIRDIEAQFPDLTRRSLNRAVARLLASGAIHREGSFRSPEARYRLPPGT